MLAVQVFWSLLWFVALLGVATNEANPTFTYNGHTYSANQCTTYEYSSSVHVNGQLMTCSAGTCYACVCDTTTVSQSSCYRAQLQFGPLIGMLLSFFWTSSVLSNIVHCAAAGAVAHWWFSEHVNNSWTKSTFNRACTTSLGSIALGSMFIAIVRTVRWVVAACAESFKYPSDNAIVSRVKSCMHSFFDMLLGLIERGLSFFSKFALCYVAVYGDSFIESSRAVATLFTQKGWTALVNDDIVDSMLFCCNCAVGLLCMLVGYMYGLSVGLDSANCSLLTVLGLVGGMMMSMVVSRIMSSAVATVFVCFAEDHTALEVTHPEDYKMLSDAWIDCNCHPAGTIYFTKEILFVSLMCVYAIYFLLFQFVLPLMPKMVPRDTLLHFLNRTLPTGALTSPLLNICSSHRQKILQLPSRQSTNSSPAHTLFLEMKRTKRL